MLFEPFADGFVVQFQQTASQDDGEKDNADIDGDVHPEGCGLVRLNPGHLHIHQRIVGNVERIGQLAQPLADFRAPGVGGHAATPRNPSSIS